MNNIKLDDVTKVVIHETETNTFNSSINNELLSYQSKTITIFMKPYNMPDDSEPIKMDINLLSGVHKQIVQISYVKDHDNHTEKLEDESEFEIEELFESIEEDVL